MDGMTSAEIRQAVRAALVASTDITDVVPAARIFDGRGLPVPDDKLPAILVYIHSESGQSIGYTQAPTMETRTDVAVEVYCTATSDSAIETAMDFADTVLDVLLVGQTLAQSRLTPESVRTQRAVRESDKGGRIRIGLVGHVLTVKHIKGW